MLMNWDDVASHEDRTSVPAGVYPVEVVEVRETHTKDGSERWAVRLDIADGEFAGRIAAWDGLVWSDRALPRAKRILEALGFPVEGEQELQPAALVGRRARVELVHEDYENGAGVVTRRTAVPYDGWGPLEGPGVDCGEGTREALGRDSPF